MNFDILLEQIGEDGVYALSNGLYTYIYDETVDIVNELGGLAILDVLTIDTLMDKLACLRVIRVQYDELGKALDEYAIPKEKED